MSIFNALTTAVSGINAQSTAFTNLSNNIANSQTVGYKASETSFQDFVSNSVASTKGQAVSQGVGAVTTTATQQQGTISTSTNPLAVAISGNGFFNVSQPASQATSGTMTFNSQQYYTRNGNFYQDKNGYLVNTSGYYLEGYQVDAATGKLNNTLTQIKASDVVFRPTATTTLSTSGALAVGATTSLSTKGVLSVDGSSSSSSTIYDSDGNTHLLSVNWSAPTPQEDGTYTTTLSFGSDDTSTSQADSTMSMDTSQMGSYTVTFSSDGTIKSVTDSSGAPVSVGAIPLSVDYTNKSGVSTSQTISLDIGTAGNSADGVALKTSANDLVISPVVTSTASSQTSTIYDSEGNAHTLNIDWGNAVKQTDGSYKAILSFGNGDTGSSSSQANPTMSMDTSKIGSYTVLFNSDGEITSIEDASGNSIAGGYSGQSAAIALNVDYTDTDGLTTTQPITFNIGTIGSSTGVAVATTSNGLTAGTLTAPVSDSVTSGTYNGLEMESDGSIMATFTNGDTQLVGKVALSSFANADGLTAVNGQAYVATSESGSPTTGVVGANGTGSLETSSTESSTTDLTSDLSSMIVAQEAYTANTKVVTTADTLLQATIAMIR